MLPQSDLRNQEWTRSLQKVKELEELVLIRGCIPSKAMIHAAHKFHDLAKHAKEGGHMGISIPGPAELKMAELKGWKDDIVDRLNKGVEHLLKAAGAELITGWAEFKDAKTVVVGDTQIEAENVILANGSVPIELPFMKYGDGVISSREALDIDEKLEHQSLLEEATLVSNQE